MMRRKSVPVARLGGKLRNVGRVLGVYWSTRTWESVLGEQPIDDRVLWTPSVDGDDVVLYYCVRAKHAGKDG